MPFIAYSFCGACPVKVLSQEPSDSIYPCTRWKCRVIGKGCPGFKVGDILHGVAGDMIFDKARFSKSSTRTHYSGKLWRERFLH